GAEEAELLFEKIFTDPKTYTDRDVERLFKFAKSRHRIDIITRLRDEVNYGPAKQYMGEYTKAQKSYAVLVRNNNQKKVQRIVERFGTNIREDADQMTGLMLAAQYGNERMLQYFLQQDASLSMQDALGRTALQHLLLGYDRQELKLPFLKKWYAKLAPAGGQCRYDNRLYSISRKSMEFYLLNLLNALRLDVFGPNDPLTRRCLLMDDFMEIIEEMPPAILPDYRRKRQYVNSILSKNEVSRKDPYNKKLFIRRSRGCYDLLPEAKISWV
ncbi:MAG: ankyrin repeat domain-containing protein, partial [Bacteroidota bacterium]